MSTLTQEVTLLSPYGYSSGTCGYCGTDGGRSKARSSKKYGMAAPQMTCQFYQDLIDRGWRRSGEYLYHPDNSRSCCPQFTIRLAVSDFKPSKKHRQVVNRWNRYLSTGTKPGDKAALAQDEPMSGSVRRDKGKAKASAAQMDFWQTLTECEEGWGKTGVHRFETKLVPAKATRLSFELYKKYQVAIHKDDEEDLTLRGFQRFLCDSPLINSKIFYASEADTSRLPSHYGSYHMLYYVESELIGISVIDVLPACVSSVYFIWHPDWAWASLGKLSAMREAALVNQMREAGAAGMEWEYMGYWIGNCQKMRYKGEFSPSYLLDTATGDFHPLTSQLDAYLTTDPHRPFFGAGACSPNNAQTANGCGKSRRNELEQKADEDGDGDQLSSESDDEEALNEYPSPPPPGLGNPLAVTDAEYNSLLVLLRKQGKGRTGGPPIVRMEDLRFQSPELTKRKVKELMAAVGKERLAMLSDDGTSFEFADQAFLSFD